MSPGHPPPEDDQPPKRDSWSLRTIVEDVSGRTLEEFQDPARTPHPYLRIKPPPLPAIPPSVAGSRAAGAPAEEPYDPVGRVYPPLFGAVGRALHGPEHEHHPATLETVSRSPGAGPGRPASPGRRPERIYLHYLLLHVDRLGDHALRYLKHAVDEELSHRSAAASHPGPE